MNVFSNLSVVGVTYIGCYRDTGTRDLKGQVLNHGSMTLRMCRDFCQAEGALYFGVQVTVIVNMGHLYTFSS